MCFNHFIPFANIAIDTKSIQRDSVQSLELSNIKKTATLTAFPTTDSSIRLGSNSSFSSSAMS